MASVAEIDGLTISSAPAFVGLLDTYTGAAAGYSTRRLASSATNLMRIRRASDNVEADVGFDSNNELGLTSPISNTSDAQSYTDFADFVDHTGTPTNAFLRYWYDQSGNANDAGQSTATKQPQIYDGALLTNSNGNTAVQFRRLGTTAMTTPAFDMYNNGWFCVSAAEKTGTVGDQKYIDSFGGTNDRTGQMFRHPTTGLNTTQWPLSGDPQASVTTTISSNQSYLWTSENTSSNLSLYVNGASQGSSSITSQNDDANGFTIGARKGGTEGYSDTNSSEIIYWPLNQSDNRTTIEGNINAHFQIGNFGTPTSGLLFDYPDAAAAYSVRQLANTAPFSMRVRRDTAGGTGDDDEADVLFDFTLTDPTISLDSRINNPSTGVASTTLGEFLNATGYTDVDSLGTVADGFCDTWYDQSGNGNDAEQTGFSSQPQIFDSASPTDLITENGKPVLRPVGGDTLSTTGVDFTSANTFVFVGTQTQSTANVLSMDGTPLYITASGSTSACTYGFSPTPVYYHNGTEQTTTPTRGEAYTFLTAGQRLLTSVFGDRAGTDMVLGREIGQAMADTQELIVWLTDQETAGNRTGIETNINTYFSIT